MARDALLWLRIGDTGEYEEFDSLDDALEYLNALGVGQVEGWQQYGFVTPNYHGQDYISIFWGEQDANPRRDLNDAEHQIIEDGLEENYL